MASWRVPLLLFVVVMMMIVLLGHPTYGSQSVMTTSRTTTNGTTTSDPTTSGTTTSGIITSDPTTSDTTTSDPSSTRRQHFRTFTPPPCLSMSSLELCEEDEEYDEEIANVIRDILKNSNIGALLRETTVMEHLPDSTITEDNSGSAHARFGPDASFSPACGGKREIITPERAQNIAGEYVYVVNNQDDIWQQIIVEKCINGTEDRPCRLGFSVPPTAQTKCRQMHVYRKLFVLSDSGRNITREEVLIPSCCSCHVSNSARLVSGL